MSALLGRLSLLWVIFITPLLFWTASFDMFEQPKQLALKAAAPVVALAAVSGFIPPALAIAIGGLLACGIFSTIFSPLPSYSLFGEYSSYQGWLHWLALGLLLAALARQLRQPGEPRRFMAFSAVSAGLVSAYALVQLAGMDPVSWSNGGPVFRAFSTAGNPLYLGFLLAALAPACLGLARSSPTKTGRNSWLALALLVLLGTLSSGSRSAAAGALAGSGLVLGPGFFRPAGKQFPSGLFTGLVALIMALSFAFLPADRNPVSVLSGRLGRLVHGGDSRPLIWSGAGRLIRENPLIGRGLDTFATLHPRVQSPRLWEELWHSSPEKPHNEFIQVAVSAGIPASGLLAWLCAWLSALAWRNRQDPLCAAAGAGLVAMAVPAMFGFVTCGTQAAALLFSGVLVSRTTTSWNIPLAWWRFAGAVLAVSLAIHLQFAASLVSLKSAVRDGGTGIDQSLSLRTPWAQDLLQGGDILEHTWFGPGISAASPDDRRVAMLTRIYSRALSANPLHAFCHSAAGRAAFRAGDPASAILEYEKARHLAPQDAYLPMEEAQILLSSRRKKEGIALLETAAGMYPRFGEPAGMLGYLWLAEKNTAKAESWLRKAVEGEWYGNNAAAYAAAVNLVVLYRNAGRWNDSSWAESVAARYAPKP